MNKLLLLGLISILAIALVTSHATFAKSKADKKAEKSIDKAIGKGVEGRYASIDMVNVSKFNDSTTITVYNKTGGSVSPSPPPVPPPTPTPTGFKLCMAGDFTDSKVFDAMKKNGCNYRIALGDMGYGTSLSLVKSIAPDRCVIGNHDAPEDGSSAIYKEALALCGNSWWQKINNSTLLLGFNTNGELTPQLTAAKSIVSTNPNLKNIIAISHKNGHVFPNAHHPAEATELYSSLEKMIPNGVKMFEVSGHNHNLAAAANGLWFISGAGGKSHYQCGVSAEWPYCNNSDNGYLQFTIDNQGQITPNFLDTSNKVIH